jgi:hypothetical protein
MKAVIRIALLSLVLVCSVFAGTGAPPPGGNYSGKITVTTASPSTTVTLKTSQIIKARYIEGSPGTLFIYYQAIPRLGAIESQYYDYVTLQIDAVGTGTAKIQVGQTTHIGTAATTGRTIKLSFVGGTDPDWFYEIALTHLAR